MKKILPFLLFFIGIATLGICQENAVNAANSNFSESEKTPYSLFLDDSEALTPAANWHALQQELDDLSPRDKAVGHLRVYSLESLIKEIEETGFRVLEKRGFFTKALSNAQMINLDPEVFRGLCKLSSNLPAEMGANIGLVCKNA